MFWQWEVGGAAGRWLAAEFQLPAADWLRRSNGGLWGEAMSGLLFLLFLPPTPCSSHPLSKPLSTHSAPLPRRWLSHIVYYGLRCDSQQHNQAICCWSIPLWQLRDSFGRAPWCSASWFYLGTGLVLWRRLYPSAMTVDLFALLGVLVITSSAMEGK